MATALAATVPPTAPSLAPSVAETAPMGPESIPDMIERYAPIYGVSREKALAVAWCESQYQADPPGSNDHGLAYGVYQFHYETFRQLAVLYGDETLDYHSTEDQIKLALWAFAHGYAGEWTCANGIF